MFVDDTAYLLAQDEKGTEWVQRYSRGDVAEVFNAEEIAELSAGRTVLLPTRYGSLRFVDMVAAARGARAEA
jgi:hypothetical protein